MRIHFISISPLRSLHCNNIVITQFSFSYNYYVRYAVIKTKTLFFLFITKLILPLPLPRWDLETLHIFNSLLLLRSLQRDSDKKNIILTFPTFIFLLHPRLLLPSPCHDQGNSFFHFFATFIRHDQKKTN